MAVQAATNKPQDGVTSLQNDTDKYIDSSLTFYMSDGKTTTYIFSNSISIQDNANGIAQFHIDGLEIEPENYSAYEVNVKLNPHRAFTTYKVNITVQDIEAKIKEQSSKENCSSSSFCISFMTCNLVKILDVIASDLSSYLDKAIEKQFCVEAMIESARNPSNPLNRRAGNLYDLLKTKAKHGNANTQAMILHLLVEQADLSKSKVRTDVTTLLTKLGFENAIEKKVHEPSILTK